MKPGWYITRIVCSLTTILWLGSAGAQDRPELVCAEPEYFFGAVSNTNNIQHVFLLANDGDRPLTIYRVKSDCGCLLIRQPVTTLAPGEETALAVKYLLKGRRGPQRRRIAIESDDPVQPRFFLYMFGEALAEIEIDPEQVYWGNIRADGNGEKQVEIKFTDGPYRILAVSNPAPFLAAAVATAPAGRILVRLQPPLPLGSFYYPLQVITDHPRFPELAIPMQGRVVGELYAVPEALALNADDQEPVNRTLLVKSSRRQSFRILRVDSPAPSIRVNIRTTILSGWRLDVQNLAAKPELDGRELIIVTDCAAMPELRVPIRVMKSGAGEGK